eukprot:Nk52_evm10s470 gene=Nk52_evmTU10s470
MRGSRYVGVEVNQAPIEIAELASQMWKVHVFEKLKTKLRYEIFREIEKDRDGEMVNHSVVHGVIMSFVQMNRHARNSLQLYVKEFETPFLEATATYYERESAAFLMEKNCSSYMQKAEVRLDEEVSRARKFLDMSSYEKVARTCETKLVTEHQEMMQVECEKMVRKEMLDDLMRMYKLLRRIPDGINPMLSVFQKYVTETGLKEMSDLEGEKTLDPKNYVETLLDVHRKHSDLVERAFSVDAAFVAALDKACRTVVNFKPKNEKSHRAPELLARFCDMLLKKGPKEQGETEIEEKLTLVMKLFKYVDDKDVFQTFYSKMCAKRLIHGTSVSLESEMSMITKLKIACGYEYTSKLQRMFTDITVSANLNTSFKEQVNTNGVNLGCDFHILVLQWGAWPVSQASSLDFAFPRELEKCVQHFEGFYNTRHSGRKLTWYHHLSKVELTVNHLKKHYEITTTAYQMAILLIFNHVDKATYSDIGSQTKLAESVLRRTVQSLIDSKFLIKSPSGSSIEANDEFTLNMKASFKRTKFKITQAVQAETPQETEKTHQSIDSDRKLYLQAALVRIMKARKTLSHLDLVNEVINQCKSRFAPSVPMIKKCIEGLIDRQYIERYEGARDTYTYLA